MDNKPINAQHSSLSYAGKMKDICKPLKIHLGLTYFSFIRQFNDRSRICLTSSGEWHEHFCDSKLYLNDKFDFPIDHYQNGISSWKIFKDTPVYIDAINNFDIEHGVTIIQNYKTHCDFFHFGSLPLEDGQIIDYIEILSSLNYFIFSFKEKGLKLIEESDIIRFPDFYQSREEMNNVVNKRDNDFVNNLGIKRYHVGNDRPGEYLTPAQLEIVKWIIKGKTTEEIAIILGKSISTIKNHISNILTNLSCANKQQLITKLINSPISTLI